MSCWVVGYCWARAFTECSWGEQKRTTGSLHSAKLFCAIFGPAPAIVAMAMIEDAELLRRYADEKSETAFAELVRRHLDLVYSVALRQVAGDAHLAEDVSQRVFAALARKARALSACSSLSGWLYRAAHFAASDAVRTERRRRAREQEVFAMNQNQTPSDPVDWDRVRPVLDAAIAELGERDRDALSLRFLEGRPFAEVGVRLRLTENAARMRVDRALDKLHVALGRRGVTSTATAIGIALANPAAAAPAGLAVSVTSTALAGATVGGSVTLLGLLTMSKTTTGITLATLVVLGTTSLVEMRANRELRTALRSLSADQDEQAGLRRESTKLDAALQKLAEGNPAAAELAQLQKRAAVLAARPPGVVDAALKPATQWTNAGRATPEAALETFHWALFASNPEAVARFVVFDDDTPEAREAFMAHFSEAVRAKHPTPERLLAAAFFGAGMPNFYSPADAFQIFAVDDHVGGNGSRFGQKRVRVWYSLASGQEQEGSTRWQPTPEGWAVAAFSLGKDWQLAQSRLDPATGNLLPPPGRK